MRLHELAKKLGVSSKDVMDACRTNGIEVKTHFVAATPDIVFLMNKVFGGRSAARVEVGSKPEPVRPAKPPARKSSPPPARPAGRPAPAPKPAAPSKSPAMTPSRKTLPAPPPHRPASPDAEKSLPPAGGPEQPGAGGEGGGETGPRYSQHHVHRPKRANFKSHSSGPIMAEEPRISDRYEHVIFGGGGSGGGGRRGGGRRRRRRPNAQQLAARAAQGRLVQTISSLPSSAGARAAEGPVELTPPVTPRELSSALGLKLESIIKFLIGQGIMASINDPLPNDLVELLALENKREIKFVERRTAENEIEEAFEAERDETKLAPRPPVVAFLGHVDHGKTSLLDYIRRTRVVDTESGGITQHIGAYRAKIDDHEICFLDTPGHEAFSAMRARGAHLTDIVVLVVAADDGVMPQTREAYAHAKAAGVSVVVAINKCDLPNANIQRAMQELASMDEGLLPEAWGGKTGMIQVSAITGDGVDDLLERILLEAEILELKADADRAAEGRVLEARMSDTHGAVVNVLVQNGTLCRGDAVLCGPAFGKIKAIYDENGKALREAGPATPVSIAGLSGVPEAGDRFLVVENLAKAREVAETRTSAARRERLHQRAHVSLANLTEYLQSAGVKDLRVVLKADVVGSLEVLRKTLNDLATDEVKINIIHAAVGGINHADVILADASDAIVLGFHVITDAAATTEAEARGVEIKIYHIIYRIVEDMKAALSGLLPPEEREIVQGHVEIRQVFKVSRLGNIAGCWVQDGIVTRTSRVRLFRDNVMIYEGRLASLQRFKDQVREVRAGFECGLRVDGYDNIQIGDRLEAYTTEEVARTLK